MTTDPTPPRERLSDERLAILINYYSTPTMGSDWDRDVACALIELREMRAREKERDEAGRYLADKLGVKLPRTQLHVQDMLRVFGVEP